AAADVLDIDQTAVNLADGLIARGMQPADGAERGEISQHEIEIAGRRALAVIDEWTVIALRIGIGAWSRERNKIRPFPSLDFLCGAAALRVYAVALTPAPALNVSRKASAENRVYIVIQESDPDFARILAKVFGHFLIREPAR